MIWYRTGELSDLERLRFFVHTNFSTHTLSGIRARVLSSTNTLLELENTCILDQSATKARCQILMISIELFLINVNVKIYTILW